MLCPNLSNYENIKYNIIPGDFSANCRTSNDHALRIANILDINTDPICKENPLAERATLPELLPEAGGLLTDANKNSYIKHQMTGILMLFDYDELPQVDQLLVNFYYSGCSKPGRYF